MDDERYPHPFHYDPHDGDREPGMRSPRTALDLKMCSLSAHIRQKPRWWEKIRDDAIREKWIQEAKEQQAGLRRWEKLSDNMLNFVMQELETYSQLRDPETGIECGPCDGVYLSDSLVPEELRQSLIVAVKPLENVPETEKDWHPGSNERVLDLVHPSLYPILFEETWGRHNDGTIGTFNPPSADELGVSEQFVSGSFQWLPSDFAVSPEAEGSVKLASPYINNIPPQCAPALVPVIEHIMTRAIPLWERVLSSLRAKETPERVGRTRGPRFTYDKYEIECIFPGEPLQPTDDNWDEDADEDEWLETAHGSELVLPDAPAIYKSVLQTDPESLVSLAGSKLQVIVKLANIMLTPEKPDYPGGVWHVEGMATESIVSTFIYYYDAENIKPCNLHFRMATSAPGYHGQDDYICMSVLYGFTRYEQCVQDIGCIPTTRNRCIAFPNLYQHQVAPFKLVDPTKAGFRKILVFFLVDPTTTIPSATNVPPQQLSVLRDILLSMGSGSRLALLPVELITAIARMVPGVQSRAEAETVREELMQERSVMIKDVNKQYFAREFNMCEH
ncbi:hypothetical protein C8F01DRAFT_1102053 [Mycena amicta]|nr:hypothetical protein C8F01DRAFT_1102053 [Mycena amicta]